MSTGPIKRKGLASSVSPETNKPKKQYQEGDTCVVCKTIIVDAEECSIECQWCQKWVHSKCTKLSDEECAILQKSNTNIMFFCPTCVSNLDEALELFDDNKTNSSKLDLQDDLPDKQNQLESQLSIVESKLLELKEELCLQISKCREMFSSSSTNTTKPPPLIANTVVTALNEEREREKRQLSLIVHNLTESKATEGEARKRDDIKEVIDILKYLGAKANVTKALRLGKKSDKPRLLKISVDSVESKAFILRNCTNLRKTEPSNRFNKIYITPDLTPAEREANRQLRIQLKEMNKDGNRYKIKNGRIVQRRD